MRAEPTPTDWDEVSGYPLPSKAHGFFLIH